MSESVWDYPRPPAVDADARLVEVVFGGKTIASTAQAMRVLETSHPPVFYIPISDVSADVLREAAGSSFCEFKGVAEYFDVISGESVALRAAWHYPDPTAAYGQLLGHVAFYPSAMDECRVGEEVVDAQEGDFYGGWITSEVAGPFKGAPGTLGW